MSKVIIPISVELGNSLQQIKQVNKEFETLADTASQPLQSALPDAPVKSIKQQLREANVELQNAVATFGKLSPQAQTAAQKVAELKDVIEDSNRAAQAGDIDDAFQVAGRAVAGVAGAFQSVLAVQGLFGEQSKATEEVLKKVQAAMALTQGISSIIEGKKAFEALGASASKALAGIKTGVLATGIGVLIVGVGLLVAYWDEITAAVTGTTKAQDNLNKAVEDSLQSYKKAYSQAKQDINEVGNAFVLAKEGVISKEKALKIYNDTLGDTFGKTNDYNDAERVLTANANLYIEAQAKKAKANALYALSAEAAAKGVTAGLEDQLSFFDKLLVGTVTLYGGAAAGYGAALETQNKNVKKVQEQSKSASEAILKLANDENKSALEIENGYKKVKVSLEDSEKAKDEAERKAKERAEKIAKAQIEANKIQIELSRRGATESQQAIFKIQDEYAQKRKTFAEAGIKDFTQLNKAEAEDIAKVQDQSNKSALKARKSFENALGKIFLDGVKKTKELQEQADEAIKNSRELAQRAELSAIKDEAQKKRQELRNAENKEMEELEKAYQDKKISLEKFLQDQAEIEAFYTNQRAGIKTKEQEEELKRLQDFQSTISDSIAEAADAFGTALAEGADPFQAVFKSLANSLGGYLQQLGKDAIKTSILIQSIKKAIGTPAGIVTGIALIALGAAIKAAFNRKTEKGFARGGFIYGPGTETSDSIPARLSRGEYVVQAKSVRKYGARTMDKINRGDVPVASLILATEKTTGRNGGSATALVNRSGEIQLFSDGGLAESFRQFGRNGGSTTALVNRFESFDPFRLFGRNGGSATALVNRSAVPNIGGENFRGGEPYIVTTKISGQDLKLVLERADRRFSNAT